MNFFPDTAKGSLAVAVVVAGIAMPASADAEAVLSVYGGANFSPHSVVNYNFNQGAGPQRATVGWDGASFQMPPYYGIRGTWWLEEYPEFGLAIDFTHAKVKASPLPAGFTTLEFTDGINFLTANALYRKKFENGFTPYAGVGVGLSIPHVEVDDALNAGAPKTFEYQVTGAAVQGFVGVDYALSENWSVFGEFKSTYGQVKADLQGGGTLDTNIISNQVMIGVSYKVY